MNIREILSERVLEAMIDAGAPAGSDPAVTPSRQQKFGDYQANGAMSAAKLMGVAPRELAQAIIERLELDTMAERVEIAGPGFINIFLHPQWLGEQLATQAGERQPQVMAETVVVDYSSPNLAKEMHVGHLRSTIIGDAVSRVLEHLGYRVIRQNHVGDWGTQFGMLLAELEEQLAQGERSDWALADLERFYQLAKRHFDDDPAFAERAREYVVRLQSGDPHVVALWERFRQTSLQHCQQIYELLDVALQPQDVRGESAYNTELSGVVELLKERNLAVTDNGAQVVFIQELADKKGNPSPMIVQKQDGGYLYSTSDLAAVRYRAGQLRADRIMVFSDARQTLHMQQVYITAQNAGLVNKSVSLEHHSFGTLMGPDGRPFKTRDGGTIKLADLLNEAVERAARVVQEKNPELEAADRALVARHVGIGAVKYADLSKTRTHDYVFDWDQMLRFEGNTGPYLQYAYTRISSLFRRAGAGTELPDGRPVIETPEEKALAIKCLQFPEVLQLVAEDAMPHVLCNYLYELASLFSGFYENCPVLKDDIEPVVRASRLLLCRQVADRMRIGLGLLGIRVLERM